MFRLCLHVPEHHSSDVCSSWLDDESLAREDVQGEMVLAVNMVMNAWQLLNMIPEDDDVEDSCQLLNICELGFNGSFWGNISEVFVDFAGKILSRFVSETDEDEVALLEALR